MKRAIVLFLTVAAVLSLLSDASGDGGCYGRSRTAFYGVPTYVAPVYHHAPVHHAGYAYWNGGMWGGSFWAPGWYTTHYPYQAYVQTYFSVDNSYRDALLLQAIRGMILEGRQPVQAGAGLRAPQQGIAPQQPAPPLQALPPDDPASYAARPSRYQNEKLLASVTESCVRCHGPQKASKGLCLVTADGKALADVPQLLRFKSAAQVLTGRMPMQGDKVKDDVVPIYFDWAQE